MKRNIHFCLVVLLHTFLAKAQAPQCSGNFFYQSGVIGCIYYHPISNPTISLPVYAMLPGNASGLALGPNFSALGPALTYWTVVNGIYCYYNGTNFVSTGHSSGGVNFNNPGASANYIYNISSSGQVSRYDGTGSASVIATFTDCLVGSAIQDIAGDKNDNFYIMRTTVPQSLSVYDAAANFLCAYSVNDCPATGHGMAINNGTVNILSATGYSYSKIGVLTGNTIVFTSTVSLPCGILTDFASCPSEVNLNMPIKAIPGAVLPCQGGTVILTSNDAANSNSYLWSGPGIIGTIPGQSITVSSPGVYTRTHTACSGLADTRSFTVTQTQAGITALKSASVRCSYDPAVTLLATGLGNYTWTPAASLSSATGSMVSASPVANTTYTVSGQLNGCSASAVISISAATIPNLNPATLTPSICAGTSAVLSTQVNTMTLNWMPGNYSGSTFTISPAQSVVYTLTATHPLGCSASETIALTVFNVPAVNVTASVSEICDGETVVITATGATDYVFYPGGSTGPFLSASPQSTTIYTITGSNWNCTNSKTFTLNVHALPQLTGAPGNAEICKGETGTMEVQGADSYLWDIGGNGSSVSVAPLITTTYNVKGYSAFGCSSTISLVQKVSDCTGIKGHAGITGISVYPNPGNGNFFIDKGSLTGEIRIRVYSITGREILTQPLPESKTNIRLNDLAKGLYIIRLSGDGREFYNGIYSLE